MVKKIKILRITAICMFAAGLLFSVLFAFWNHQNAYAALSPVATANCSFSQLLNNLSDGQDMQQTYNYTFVSLEDDNPMPKGSYDNKFSFDITGNSSKDVEIDFNRVGVYKYVAYLTDSSAKEYYSLDESEYYINVYVSNKEPSGLEANVLIAKNSPNDKVEKAQWTHSFKAPSPEPQPTPQPQADNSFANFVQTMDMTYFIAFIAVALLAFIVIINIINKKSESKN